MHLHYSSVSWDYPEHDALAPGALRSRLLRIACASTRPRPPPHSPWPKPPHYHAALLRAPVPRRKGLFRTVLPPDRAVDFFRWELRVRRVGPDPGGWSIGAWVRVAESVLEPYEAAAGFAGWHGVGVDVARRADHAGGEGIGEEQVEEGRVRWAYTAEELVGPPGVPLRWVVTVAPPSNSKREDAPDMASCSSRPASALDDKWPPLPSTASTSKHRSDSPSIWWCGPPPLRAPPPMRLPALRYPPPSVQYAPPPWFPGMRVPSQGHYPFGAQPIGAPSPMSHDPRLALAPSHSPRCPAKSSRDEYPSLDDDKETETDHGYESTTTTTDSDPPPHTPINAGTVPHSIEALQVHGDDDVEVHGVEIDADHAAGCVRLSDPTTPVKLLGRFTNPASPLVSSDSEGDGDGSSKATVVFPSLNGSFRQGSLSQASAQTTPARTVTPITFSPLASAKSTTTWVDLDLGSKTEPSDSDDGPAFTLSLSLLPSTKSSPGVRRDSHGFWESALPISPCSSSSSLPPSPSEGKACSRRTAERTGDEPLSGMLFESETRSPLSHSTKSRSLSSDSRHLSSAASTRSSGSQLASLSSPTSTPAPASLFGGSYPPSPSSPNGSSNSTTLLPAFLATTSAKRKKTSRTREIVDQLRSSSIDAGKGAGLDGLGWPSAESDGTGKNQAPENHVAGGQPSLPPSKSTKSCESGSGGKSNETTQAAAPGNSRSSAATANTRITPFPILSVSQPLASSQAGGPRNREPVTSAPSDSANAKTNATVASSPGARSSGSHLHNLPDGGTPPKPPPHHPHTSPSHPIVHPLPPVPLGPPPPPMIAVPFSPVYMSFPQYHLAPAHQGQPTQGTWLAVYPGRPAPMPMHPHVAPITGISGMRHATW